MRATRSVTLRVEASVAEASSISFDCLSVSAVVLRLSASAATLFTVSAPWLTILVKSVGSRATITSPFFVGGASAVPTVISTMRSPSSPCVSMRDRILPHPVRELLGDREIDADLAAGLGRQVDGLHAADLHAGQPHRRTLVEAADLAEIGMHRVARLEQARTGAERVHHPDADYERHEDEDAHAELLAQVASLVVHLLTSLRRPGMPARRAPRTS